LRYSYEIDLFLSLIAVQKGGTHATAIGKKKAHVPTSNEPKLLVVIISNKNK